MNFIPLLLFVLAFKEAYSFIGLDKEFMDKDILQTVIGTAFQNIKKLQDFKKVLVVIGNETCDLDSAISSLIYSLLLHINKPADSIVIPVFNIPRSHLPVKTEVVYLLKKFGVDLNHIICRDEIDLAGLEERGSLELTLVDHHVLSLSDQRLARSVVGVLDHRPQNPAWLWDSPRVALTLTPVGSCATLVADKLLTLAPHLLTPTIAMMLLGPILLDTANLSAEVGRASTLDHQMVDKLKGLFDLNKFYQELQLAKSDVSSLSAAQLLVKDVKVAGGIPIAGLPMKVAEFMKRADVESALRQFCNEHNAPVSVIYGSRVENGRVTRDIAIYSPENLDAANKVLVAITTSTDPLLGLVPQSCSVQGVTLFEAKNIRITRKQFLPLIRRVGEIIQQSLW